MGEGGGLVAVAEFCTRAVIYCINYILLFVAGRWSGL